MYDNLITIKYLYKEKDINQLHIEQEEKKEPNRNAMKVDNYDESNLYWNDIESHKKENKNILLKEYNIFLVIQKENFVDNDDILRKVPKNRVLN